MGRRRQFDLGNVSQGNGPKDAALYSFTQAVVFIRANSTNGIELNVLAYKSSDDASTDGYPIHDWSEQAMSMTTTIAPAEWSSTGHAVGDRWAIELPFSSTADPTSELSIAKTLDAKIPGRIGIQSNLVNAVGVTIEAHQMRGRR